MISYSVYKLVHIISIMLIFFGFGGVALSFAATPSVKAKIKMIGFITHGVGLVLLLVSGFGMAARLGWVTGLPTWVYVKIAIWVILGALIAVAKRMNKAPSISLVLTLGFASFAAYLAIHKPM